MGIAFGFIAVLLDRANDYIKYGDKKIPMGFSTSNRILDMFKLCKSNVGKILYEFAKLLGNNFSIFPLSNLCVCNTFNDIFASKSATDDVCSFYPLFSIIDYMYGEEIDAAAASYGSKIYCIKDGWFWSGYKIRDGYRTDSGAYLCGVYYVNIPYYSDASKLKIEPVTDKHCAHTDGGVRIGSKTYIRDGFFIFSGFSCFRHIGSFYSDSSDGYTNVLSSIIDGAAGRGRRTYINFDTNLIDDRIGCISFDINGDRNYKLGDGDNKNQNRDAMCRMEVHHTVIKDRFYIREYQSDADNTGLHVTNIVLNGGTSAFNSVGIISCDFGLSSLHYTIGAKL